MTLCASIKQDQACLIAIFADRIVGWEFGDRRAVDRIIYLTTVRHWDTPHGSQQLTDFKREELRGRLRECYEARKKLLSW